MLISKSTLNFLPDRIQRLLDLNVQSKFNERTLTIPVKKGSGLTNARWSWSWKTEVIKRLCRTSGGSFIDVGANVGQTLIDHYLADTKTRYIGFEPNPACNYYLSELIKINSLSQYTLLPVGLASETKIVPLFTRKDTPDDDCATLISDLRPNLELASQFVPCYKFDEVCQTLGLQNISLIKIDVEGSELEVIKGMRASIETFQPAILCEVLFADLHADASANKSRNEELMRLLAEYDYRVLQLVKSPDDTGVTEAKPVEAFENLTYSAENKNLCDYLFVPAKSESRITAALFADAGDAG